VEEMVVAAEETVEEMMGLHLRMKNPVPTILTIEALLKAFSCHPKVLTSPQFLE